MKLTDYVSPAHTLDVVARRNADRTAIVFDNCEVSFSALDALVRAYAAQLVALGVRAGDRVAILSKNSVAHVAVMFGAFRIGAVVAPMNWRLTAIELDVVMQDAAPIVCAHSGEFAELLSGVPSRPARTIRLDDSVAVDAGAEVELVDLGADHLAMQLYTSGTTGRAKGAMFTNRCLARFTDLQESYYPDWFQVPADTRYAVTVPLFHIGGLEMMFRTLFSEGCIILLREFSVEGVLEAIDRHRATIVAMVPTAIQMVLASPGARDTDFSSVRTLFYGGAPIAPTLLQEALTAIPNCRFVQTYGMTEATGAIMGLPPEDHALPPTKRMRSVGMPLPHTEAQVIDANGRAVGPGEVGEIAIRSPFIMVGYHNREDLDVKTVDPGGWLHSGDAGSYDEDGYYYIHDRVSDMIISGGENVYPTEVEAVLCRHPAVAQAAVIGIPDAKWGERIHGVVVLREDAELDEAEIIRWMRSSLAGYKIPKSLTAAPALPTNAIGKVARRLVKEQWLAVPRP